VIHRSRRETMPNIQVQIDAEGEIPVLRVAGFLDIDTTGRLLLATDDAWHEGLPTMVLDLGSVEMLDSTGVSELMLIKKRFARKGTRVCLCCLSEVAHHVLDMMRLHESLDVYPTAREAIQATRDMPAPVPA
jgi:anti-anti-sigma factor